MAEPSLKAVTEIFKTIDARQQILEGQDAALAEREAQLALVDDTLRKRREYAEALERHVTSLEERLRLVREQLAPEERTLQARLVDIEQQVALAEERRHQANQTAQMAIDDAARRVRELRGGQL
jgi:chromosome condensin MukBEF complex kleisin-like MukF subunit